MARVAPAILELGEVPPLCTKKRVEVRKAVPKLPPSPSELNCSNDPRVENRAVICVAAGEELQGNCSEDLADAHHEECQDFPPFNMRKYVYSIRSKDFTKCWPFPNKYLDFCLERGWKPKLPPFDSSSSVYSQKNLQEGTLPGKTAGSSNGLPNTLALKESKEHEDPSKEGSMGCEGNTETEKRDGQNHGNEEQMDRVFEAEGYEESIGDKLEAVMCDGDPSREFCGQRSISEKSSGVCTVGEGGGEVACFVVEAPDLKDNVSNSSCDQIVTCSDGEVHGPGAIKPSFCTLSTGGLTKTENGLDDSVSHKESEILEIEGRLNSSTLLEQNNKISKEAQTKLYYLTENGTIVKYIQGNTDAGGDLAPREYIVPHLTVDHGTPNKSINKGHLDEMAIARFPKHKGTPAKVTNSKRGSIRKSLEAAISNPSSDQEEYATPAGMENTETLEDTLMNNPSSDVIAMQVCPVCRVFNSTSNTALNAHIDHCLAMVPSSAISHSKLERLGMKARKKRSMADICAVAPVRTLEDLEKTRFEQWALFNHNLNKSMPFSWGGKVGDIHRKSRTFVYRSSPDMARKGSGDHKEQKGKRHRFLHNFESKQKQSKHYHVDEAEKQHLGMELPVPEAQEQVGGNEPTLKSKPLSAPEGTRLLDSINSLGSHKSIPILSQQKQAPFHPSRKALERSRPLSLAKQAWKQKPTHCSNNKKGRSSSAAKCSRVGMHGMNAVVGIPVNDVPLNDTIQHSPDTSAEASAIRETSPPAAATPTETESVSDPCGMDLYMADHNLETHYAIPIISHGADPLPLPIHFPRKKSIDETEHSYPKTPDRIYMASMNRDTPYHVSNPVSTCAHSLVSHPLSVGGGVDLPVLFPSPILVSSHDQKLSPRVPRKPRAIEGHCNSFGLETNARSISSHDFGFTSPVKVYETEDSMKHASFSPPLLRSQQSTCGYSNGLAWSQPIPISTPPSVDNIDQNYHSAEELSSRPNSFGSVEGASEPGVVHIFGSPVFKLMGKNVMLSNKLGLQSDPMETPAFQNMQRNIPMPMPGYLQWSECGKTMENMVERREHHGIGQPLILSDGSSTHNYPEQQYHCSASHQSPVLSQGNPQSFDPNRNQGVLASQSPAAIGFPCLEDMESWRQKIPSTKNSRPSMSTTASARTMHGIVNSSNLQNAETVIPKEHFISGGDFGTSLTMYGSSCSSVPKDIAWAGSSCLRTPYEQKGFCQASGGCSRSHNFGFFSDLQALEPNHHRQQQPTGTLSDIVQSSAGPCSIWPTYSGSAMKQVLESRNLQ